MNKYLKVTLYILLTPVLLFLIALLVYVVINKQGVVDSFQVGNQNAKYKVLIASQGSDFKEKLVNKFIEQIHNDSIFISVLDCTKLNESHNRGWDAYIIIHTMQIHKMPEETENFLRQHPDLSKIILVCTSGAGDERFTGHKIDAISSASRIVAIEPILKWAVPKINNILTHKH